MMRPSSTTFDQRNGYGKDHQSNKVKKSDVNAVVPFDGAEEAPYREESNNAAIPRRMTLSEVEQIRQSLDVSDEVVASLVELDADLNEEAIHEELQKSNLISSSAILSPLDGREESNNMLRKLLAHVAAINSKLFGEVYSESIFFALRFSMSTVIASLFLLVFPVNHPYYQSSWILVTVAIVSWSTSNDTGTILKKLGERIAGTLIGVLLSFAAGYTSLLFANVQGQAIFLGFALAIESFFYTYVADRLGYRGSYGAMIGNLTFGISLYGFYNTKDVEPWRTAIFRVINVIIGCVIVALVSLAINPMSTKAFMIKNVNELILSTGKSAELILKTASDSFQNGRRPRSIAELLWASENVTVTDEMYTMYVKNLDGWKTARSLIPTLNYDPWFWSMSEEEKHIFKYYMITHIARTFRIQLNAVLLDGIIRSDADYKGPVEALPLFMDIGVTISNIMNMKVDQDQRQAAVKLLLEQHLPHIRLLFARAAEMSPISSKVSISHLRSAFLCQLPSLPHLSSINAEEEQTLLFFHLVEQLILRVARLHFCCQQYQPHACNCCSCRI